MSFMEAIALNNLGVSHLSKGNFYSGYEVLEYALQCLDELFAHSDTIHGTHREGNREARISYTWVDFSDREYFHHRSKLAAYSNDVCPPFLCQHAVKIDIDTDHDYDHDYGLDGHSVHLSCYNDYDCDSKLRWAIIYNLALSNHLAASCLGERGCFLLRQAHQYYTAAQFAIPKIVPYKDCLRLLLATQNNLICIYLDFGMHEEHKSSLKILTELLISISNHTSLDNLEMDHDILLNLMVLSRRHFAPAA